MNTIEIIENLRKRGYELRTDGTQIHVRGTLAPLNLELIETLKQYKPEIIVVLTKRDALLNQVKKAGASSKWQDYLLERFEILIRYETYSPERAREEVLAMARLPFYQGLN